MGNFTSHPAIENNNRNTNDSMDTVIRRQVSEEYKEEKKQTLELEEKKEAIFTPKDEIQRRISIRNEVVDNAQQIIESTNVKIKSMTARCSAYTTLNRSLIEEIEQLRGEEKKRDVLSNEYKTEISSQKTVISKWKQKMEELSEEIVVIREKERAQSREYHNKLVSISDNLYKIHGDTVSKLKYNKQNMKFVLFIERINHLFYYDEHGPKLVFIRGISISNSEIQAQINDRPWFLVIGKKRSVLFVTENNAIRDKWVHFINRSLANKSNIDDSMDEISVMTSVVSVDYDLEHNRNGTMTNYTNFANQFRHQRGNNGSGSTLISLSKANTFQAGSMSNKKKIKRSNSLLPSNKNNKINVMVCYDIKEDKIKLFLKTMKKLIVETNKEKGCIKFNIHRDRKAKTKFVMMEIWESQKYLSAHLQQQHLKMYRDIIAKNDIHNTKPDVFICTTLL